VRSAKTGLKTTAELPALRYQRREREYDHVTVENQKQGVMLPPVGTSAKILLETIAGVPRSIYAGGSPRSI